MNIIYIIVFFLWSIVCYSQNVPNNSFEDWYQHSAGHEDPVYWNTANPTTNVFPINKITTEKTTDSYDGNFAAMLTSKKVLTFVAPGFVTLGEFNINLFTQVTSITGGIAFNLKPEKLRFYYKYQPATGDFCRVGLWMLRNDGTQVPDTVATALYESFAIVNNYSEVNVNLVYRNNFTPEILNIIAVSSNPNNPVEGSVLKIDKIELDYTSDLNFFNTDYSKYLFYPNPVSNFIYLNTYFSGKDNKIIEIYSLNGKLVFNEEIESNKDYIDLSLLPKGNYLLKIRFKGITHSQNLIKL